MLNTIEIYFLNLFSNKYLHRIINLVPLSAWSSRHEPQVLCCKSVPALEVCVGHIFRARTWPSLHNYTLGLARLEVKTKISAKAWSSPKEKWKFHPEPGLDIFSPVFGQDH